MSVTAGGPLSLEGSADRATCTAGALDASTAINALEAVREALDIPHAATVGDEEIRAKIIERRVMHAVTFLRGILDQEPRDLGWHVAYLRDRLAEHPATGYRTWDEAVAEMRAAKAAAAATCGKCKTAAVARPGETLPDGQPGMNARFCARCLDICHEALEFDHICIVCASQEERAALGLGGPGQDGEGGHRSADRLAERAMDVIDQAVFEGKLPG